MEAEPHIGDIVLSLQEDGEPIPAIIVKVLSPTSVILGLFVVGGMMGQRYPTERGEQPGQWQPRPQV